MANFIKQGSSIPYTPPSVAVVAGDVLVLDEKVTVSKQDIAVGELGTVDAEGTFDFPATDTTAYAVGAKVYWDAADDEATEDADSGTNKLIGYVQAALASGTNVFVRCYLVNNVA